MDAFVVTGLVWAVLFGLLGASWLQALRLTTTFQRLRSATMYDDEGATRLLKKCIAWYALAAVWFVLWYASGIKLANMEWPKPPF